MCGIWAYFSKQYITKYSITDDISKIRGPDSTNELKGDYFHLFFHRLAINDFSSEADQPFVFTDNGGYI